MAAQATVAGAVTDSSGNPISGAEVYVQLSGNLQQDYSTTTAGDGTYSLLGIPAGTYDVTIFSQGYLADTQTAIVAAAGQQATVNAALAPCGTSITGTVVDPKGNSVPQGQVEILDAAGHAIGLASIQDGVFDVTSAQGNNLSALVFDEGYAAAAPVSFNAQPSTTVQLGSITLQPVAIDQTGGLGNGGSLQLNTALGTLTATVAETYGPYLNARNGPYLLDATFDPTQRSNMPSNPNSPSALGPKTEATLPPDPETIRSTLSKL